MALLSFRKGTCGQGDVVLAVKLNFKGGLLSCIFLQDAAICQKIHICLQTGNLLSNFQIPLTHLILKLKSIVIPPHKMSRSREKNAQVENLIWCILTALRGNLKTPNLLKDISKYLNIQYVKLSMTLFSRTGGLFYDRGWLECSENGTTILYCRYCSLQIKCSEWLVIDFKVYEISIKYQLVSLSLSTNCWMLDQTDTWIFICVV